MICKQSISRLIYQMTAKDISKIFSCIENKTNVSFDVFDTIVKREVVLPQDVFALVEKAAYIENKNWDKNFAKLRYAAEQKAYAENMEKEVTLAEIYTYLPYEVKQKDWLMQKECQIEIDLSISNPAIKKIYQFCIEQGKDIFFLSDMYLPQKVICQILKKNGYTKGKVFVSSETGKTKRSGELFQFVQKKEHINIQDWIHIGDSIRADYIIPKRLGIQAILVDQNPVYNKYVIKRSMYRDINYARLNHFIDVHMAQLKDPYEKIGYAVLGPLLYGFSCWLEQVIPKDDMLVFLAREGALLKQAFEIISARPSVYLHISRRAAYMAYLEKVEKPENAVQSKFSTIINRPTYQELMSSYTFSEEEIKKIMQENKLNPNTVIENVDMEINLLQIIWSQLKEKAAKQYNLLQRYLEQLEIKDKCATIDVGWNGTIQALLVNSKFCAGGRPIVWEGYYLGTSEVKHNEIKKRGYLFEGYSNRWLNEGILNSAPFFEFLFLETSGTTKAYKEIEDGTIEPILEFSENKEQIIQKAKIIQDMGLRFVNEFSSSLVKTLVVTDANVVASNYQAIARIPSLSTLKLFCDVEHGDGRKYKFTGDHGMGYYLRHPKQFIFDFETKRGRTWFLKNLFKIPLPYIAIINLARKIFK